MGVAGILNMRGIFLGIGLMAFLAAPQPALAIHPYSPYYVPMGHLVDSANVISEEGRRKLGETVDDTQYFTGRPMTAMTVPSVQGWKPALFAEKVGANYNVGATAAPGVLVMIAVKERTAVIVQGPGMERLLTPKILASIYENEINPKLKTGNIEGALRSGADAVFAALQGTYMTQMEKLRQFLPVFIVVPLAIFYFLFFGKHKRIDIFGGGAWGRW